MIEPLPPVEAPTVEETAQAEPPPSSPAGGAPAPQPLRLRVAVLSDVGRARDQQEDACAYVVPSDPDVQRRKGELCMVADGMGGHSSGDVASATAVQEIQRAYYAAPGEDMAEALRAALAAANEAIYHLAETDARRRGMGSTAAVAALRGSEVHVANVGDSRAYLVRAGAISQITEDHSWVGSLVRAGVMAPEEAQAHPQRNLITRALGARATVEPDLFHGWLQAGDVLVLCSDGLTVHVADAELSEAVRTLEPDAAARRLVDLANDRGGSDNISVVIVRAEDASLPLTASPRQLPLLLIGGVAVVLILVVAAVALLLLAGRAGGPRPPPTFAPSTLMLLFVPQGGAHD